MPHLPTTSEAPTGKTKGRYRTQPDPNRTTMPPGIPYIVGNEAAERFSFYGMSTILTVFMTTFLKDSQGQLAVMHDNEALFWSHLFVSGAYFMPILGALLADGLLGRYRTILYVSIIYCFGHFALALNDTRLGLVLGLSLIAIGAGGIKPCVSANVGDQFGPGNKHLLPKAFGWFYFSINVGSFVSIYLCPWLLHNPAFGPRWAFGVPGILMVLATVIFWLGRNKIVHVPPGGLAFLKDLKSREGLSALGRLALVYMFMIVWWAMWYQSAGIEWTLQAEHLDLNFFGLHLLAEQVTDANAILILIFVPLFNYLIYPAVNRVFTLTPLRKIGIGLFVMVIAFSLIWWLQLRIDGGAKPTVGWQLLAYVFLTASETMVSITGLEFSYTQAPTSMKSIVMALWLLVISLGNQFAAYVNLTIEILKRRGITILGGADYFAFYTLLMLVLSVVFIFFARRYHGRTYIQGEAPIEQPVA
jgi:proton-dependent oligopeptide transporter, POT family